MSIAVVIHPFQYLALCFIYLRYRNYLHWQRRYTFPSFSSSRLFVLAIPLYKPSYFFCATFHILVFICVGLEGCVALPSSNAGQKTSPPSPTPPPSISSKSSSAPPPTQCTPGIGLDCGSSITGPWLENKAMNAVKSNKDCIYTVYCLHGIIYWSFEIRLCTFIMVLH